MASVLLVRVGEVGLPPFANWTNRLLHGIGLVPKVVVRPLGLSLLSACLKRKGHSCEILDLNTCPGYRRKGVLLDAIRKKPFDYIGFTFFTHGYQEALRAAEWCKRICPDTKIVFGGPHATFTSDENLSHSFVDFVICGEAEVSLPRLVGGENPAEIPGLALRANGRVFQVLPESIDNLDALPIADRNACLPLYYPYAPIDYLQTSRGCPKRCSFCVESNLFKKMRFRDPKAVALEAGYLSRSGAKLIYLADSNFSASHTHVDSVCREIRRVKPKARLFAEMAVEYADAEMLKTLAKSCFAGVSFGIESLSDRSLGTIAKTTEGKAYRNKALDLLKYCNRIGLQCSSYYVVPLPHQNKSSVMEEIKLLQAYGQVELMFLTPFPGTRLWDEEQGSLLTRDFSEYDSYHIVFNPSEMSPGDLRAIYRHVVNQNRDMFKRHKETRNDSGNGSNHQGSGYETIRNVG